MCYAGTKTGAVEIKEEGGVDGLLSIVKSHKLFHIQSSSFRGGGWPVIHSSPQCVLSLSLSLLLLFCMVQSFH